MNQITFQAPYQTTTAPPITVGQRATTTDGRRWVYVKANEAILKGHVVVPAATTSVGTTISSSANGDGKIVYITKLSAGWTAGNFAGGFVHIDGGTGSGQVAKIVDNTTDTLVLAPETPLATALSTDSTMEISTPFLVRKAVVTSKIQNATGVAQVGFASGDYGWVLVQGVGVVIAGEVLVAGKGFTTGDDTAGEVVNAVTATGSFDAQTIGIAINANSAVDLGALVKVTLGD